MRGRVRERECAIGKGADCVGDCFYCCAHRVMAERDELREQVARLEADDLHMINALGSMTERCYAAEADRDRLRAALRQYGAHDVTCRFDGITCRCGFSKALKGAEEAKE